MFTFSNGSLLWEFYDIIDSVITQNITFKKMNYRFHLIGVTYLICTIYNVPINITHLPNMNGHNLYKNLKDIVQIENSTLIEYFISHSNNEILTVIIKLVYKITTTIIF